MSKVAISKEKIVAVADAIREKAETTEEMGLDAMPQAIRDIKGGADFTINNASYLFHSGARLELKDILMSLLKDVTSTAYMFYNCGYNLKEIDLSGLDTKNVTDMSNMFYGCSSLTSIDVSGFDTGKVESMNNMFNGCSNISSVDLSMLDTSRLEEINGMFSGCSKLTEVDMSNFIFWNLDQMVMQSAFYNCKSLKSVKFPVREIRLYNASSAFNYCSELISIDLSCFNTKDSTASAFQSMFTGCGKLEEIIGFSAANRAGCSIGFPNGNNATSPAALKRLTFRPYEGGYSIRSAINIKYCSFERSGMVEMFNSLPDITAANVGTSYKKITITGNPCLTGTLTDGTVCETLTDEDRAIATNKGWTLVE